MARPRPSSRARCCTPPAPGSAPAPTSIHQVAHQFRPDEVHRRRVNHHAEYTLVARRDPQRTVHLSHHQLLCNSCLWALRDCCARPLAGWRDVMAIPSRGLHGPGKGSRSGRRIAPVEDPGQCRCALPRWSGPGSPRATSPILCGSRTVLRLVRSCARARGWDGLQQRQTRVPTRPTVRDPPT